MSDEAARLFAEARQLPQDARSAFIDGACGDRPALRDELASLLAHADAAERFFDRLGGAVRAAAPAVDREMARWATAGDATGANDTGDSIAADPMLARAIGRYRIVAFVGRGGMGTVYRAHDERLGRDVALKFLPPHLADDPSAVERFLVEARAAAALDHPHVATVHEIGETGDGRLFIAMAYYDGESLKQRLQRGPLAPREAAEIALAIARALGAAHVRGIVHRDVKPGNVLLARDGIPRLLDFGLARVGDSSLTGAGVTPGTPAYMSPEQTRGGPLDGRSDLWSLGVVLHEMLAGMRPFRGGSDRALIVAIQHEPPASLASCDPPVPEALRRIVERLLRKSPEDRYPDAAAVEADLAEVIAAMSAPSGPSGRGRAVIAPTPSARRRRAAGGVAAALVVALGVAIPLGARWRRPARAALAAPALPAPAEHALAVLPFTDMSADTATRYFSDGLTEEITTTLGRVEGLRVAARSSAFALRDRALDVRRIGDTLGVDVVLEGSVRRDGRRLRVTAQLVDARSGLQLWTDEYDREMADVLTMQDEIARAIADALTLRLPAAASTARAKRAINPAAYDLYLRALQLRTRMRPEALQTASQLLDRAIELQPDFPLAWAAKASVDAPRVFFRQMPTDPGLRDVRLAIDRAFALDSEIGEAHVARGLVQLFWDRDWAGAERSLRHAIDLNPSDPHAWQHMGNYLRAMDRPDAAAEARLRGLALDPLDARLRYSLAEEYLAAGRLPEARAAYATSAQLDPLHPATLGLGPTPPRGTWSVDLAQGRDTAAVQALLGVATLRGSSTDDVESLRRAFAAGGIHAFWRRWLEIDRRTSGASMDPMRIAALAAMAGDTAQALDALERADAERNPGLIFMRTEPAFASLRANPRFVRVERRMRFPAPRSMARP